VICSVNYTIEGKTREKVLNERLDIQEGEVLLGYTALEEYIADKEQLIRNERTLASGQIKYVLDEDPQQPGLYHVDLYILAKDTWNYIALPYAKYDSNEGFLLSFRGRNYNFLGGMETLELNLDYWRTEPSGDTEYSVNGGFVIPFYLWDFNWRFYFDEDVVIDENDPLELYTRMGLSVDIPFENLILQTNADQYYYLNQEGDEDPDGYYMRTAGSFGSSIPLGFDIPLLGEPSYDLALITSYNYKPYDVLSEERRGYEFGAEHEASAGRLDWLGNFRDGALFSLAQNLRYNFTREIWLSNLDAELQVHKTLGWAGLSTRFQGFYRYNDVEEDAGDRIRGILDARIEGNGGFYANIDFPVKMWIWFMDRWFEAHFSPFFDYALVQPDGGRLKLSEGWYGTGFEIFAFAKFARSLSLRASLGLDLEAMLDGAFIGDLAPRDGESIYEIYIGLHYHY
jgi:hypothetical protein